MTRVLTLTRFLMVALIGGAIALASTQLRAEDTAAREARDRAEIEALMWRYVRALDTADAKAYASAYTPDGEFRSGGPNATAGREALEKMVADIKAGQVAAKAKGETRPAMYHMTMNEQLTFVDKDHARLEAYWQTVFGAVGQGTPPRVAAAGRSVDQLVRVKDKWLIQSRDVSPKD